MSSQVDAQTDDRPKANGHVSEDPSLRTYRGRSLEEVLPQIRAELGPDAVIVRQRDGLVGGIGGFFQQQFVEVQARPGAGRMRVDLYDAAPALPPSLRSVTDTVELSTPVPVPVAPPAPVPVAPEAAVPVAPEAPEAPAAEVQPERLVPGSRPKPKLSAAELLAQATGAKPGDTRTPAEILRAHSASFAAQLADAEEHAEPVVERKTRKRGASQPKARYAPPAEAASERYAPPVPEAAEAPIPLPQKPAPAPVPEPELPPAAAAPAKPARRAAKRRGASTTSATTATRAAGATPEVPGAVVTSDQPTMPDPSAVIDDVGSSAGAGAELPESGVGPQTSQALSLAAAIAANMSAVEEARAEAERRRQTPSPRAAALTGAPALGAPMPLPLPSALPQQPRRSLFTRPRRGVTRPRHIVHSPQAVEVSSALDGHGMPTEVARDLLVEATSHVMPFTPGGDVRTAVRTALARRIPMPAPPRAGGRAVAFVGAGGGGKTRCSAGLAAAYAQGSSFPVACLTLAPLDGGAELTALLKPHGVRVEAVATAQEASVRIAELRRSAVVVLDTPAVAPGDDAAVAQLAAELALLELDEIQLTVPATLSAPVAQELVEWLAPLQPTGIAMTHGDATDHIGAVVELSCATRLPLAYVNGGLELPGAFAPADPVQIAERLLR